MKNMYFVAVLLLMIVQSSWQSALQDREEKSSFSEGAGVAENLGRRHADGTFTSDYHKYLDEEAGKEFLKWLMSNKPTQR
uniref:Preproglucagon B3 n=1 Tax=Takydromus tachydromoides TaxID=118850 RepID=A0A2S0D697_9SAUR|nr:preproglucagon B3 [Takydromus tachydromoides]